MYGVLYIEKKLEFLKDKYGIFKIIVSYEILIFRGTVFVWILGIFKEIIVRDLWICHVFDFLSIYDCNNVWWTMYEWL